MQKILARHGRSRNFENMVMSFYQEQRPECKIESFLLSGKQKKSTVSSRTDIVTTVKQYSKQWFVNNFSAPVKKLVPR